MNWRHIAKVIAQVARIVANIADRIHGAQLPPDLDGTALIHGAARTAAAETHQTLPTADGTSTAIADVPPSPGPLTHTRSSPFSDEIYDANGNHIGAITGALFVWQVHDLREGMNNAVVAVESSWQGAWDKAVHWFTDK